MAENHRRGYGDFDFMVKVFEELVQESDEANIERTIQVVCDYELVEIIFRVITRFTSDKNSKKNALVENILVILFNDALSRQWTHVGMRIMKGFEEVILRNDKRVLPSLLQSLIDSPFLMDLKLSMIKLFLPRI